MALQNAVELGPQTVVSQFVETQGKEDELHRDSGGYIFRQKIVFLNVRVCEADAKRYRRLGAAIGNAKPIRCHVVAAFGLIDIMELRVAQPEDRKGLAAVFFQHGMVVIVGDHSLDPVNARRREQAAMPDFTFKPNGRIKTERFRIKTWLIVEVKGSRRDYTGDHYPNHGLQVTAPRKRRQEFCLVMPLVRKHIDIFIVKKNWL